MFKIHNRKNKVKFYWKLSLLFSGKKSGDGKEINVFCSWIAMYSANLKNAQAQAYTKCLTVN